jgi:hypothetical protein
MGKFMKPDLRMFTIDWKTGKVTVDYGFNVQGPEEKYDTPALFQDDHTEGHDDELE